MLTLRMIHKIKLTSHGHFHPSALSFIMKYNEGFYIRCWSLKVGECWQKIL